MTPTDPKPEPKLTAEAIRDAENKLRAVEGTPRAFRANHNLQNAEDDAVALMRAALAEIATLRQQLAEAQSACDVVRGELDKAVCDSEFTQRWYGERWERLRTLFPRGSDIEKKACDIMANGHLLMDPPNRPSALQLATKRAEDAEKERDEARIERDQHAGIVCERDDELAEAHEALARNAALREALEFYANRGTWRGLNSAITRDVDGDMQATPGLRARKALEAAPPEHPAAAADGVVRCGKTIVSNDPWQCQLEVGHAGMCMAMIAKNHAEPQPSKAKHDVYDIPASEALADRVESWARCMTYNESPEEGSAKHLLYECAMRIRSRQTRSATPPPTERELLGRLREHMNQLQDVPRRTHLATYSDRDCGVFDCVHYVLDEIDRLAASGTTKELLTDEQVSSSTREHNCWPQITLNTLTVQRLAKWGFTVDNPWRDSDRRAVIEACQKKVGIEPSKDVTDAPPREQSTEKESASPQPSPAESEPKCWTCGGKGYVETVAGGGRFGYGRHSCSPCGGTGKLSVVMEQLREKKSSAREVSTEKDIAGFLQGVGRSNYRIGDVDADLRRLADACVMLARRDDELASLAAAPRSATPAW